MFVQGWKYQRGCCAILTDVVAWLLQVAEAEKWDQWVEDAFNTIDGDNSGSLDASELREFLFYGTTMSPQAMEEVLASIFDNGDGPLLSLSAFRELLTGEAASEDLSVFACRTGDSM